MTEKNMESLETSVNGLNEFEPKSALTHGWQAQAVETILAKLTNSYEANHYHPYLEHNDVGAFDLGIDDEGNLYPTLTAFLHPLPHRQKKSPWKVRYPWDFLCLVGNYFAGRY